MPWDTPQFDPSNTFGNFALRSAQAAAPVGAAFARGMELGARRRENADLEGLQKKLREYQIDKAKLDIADALNQREQQKQIRNAMTETSHILTESYQKGWWATPEGLNKIGEGLARIQARIPAVAETDTFKGMWGTLHQRMQQFGITERAADTQEEITKRAKDLEDQRQKNRIEIEELRQKGREGLRDARGRIINFDEFATRRMDTFLAPKGSRETKESFAARRAEAMAEMRQFYDEMKGKDDTSSSPPTSSKLQYDPQRRVLIDPSTGQTYQFRP